MNRGWKCRTKLFDNNTLKIYFRMPIEPVLKFSKISTSMNNLAESALKKVFKWLDECIFFLYTHINLYLFIIHFDTFFSYCVSSCEFQNSIEFINLPHNLIIQNAIFQTIFRHDISNTRFNCYQFFPVVLSLFVIQALPLLEQNNFSLLFRERNIEGYQAI